MIERLTLPPLPDTIRTLTNEESVRLEGLYPVAPRSPKHCPTCKGTKEFRWYDADRIEVWDYDCACIDQWVLNRWLLWSGIGMNYQRLGWDDMVDQGNVQMVLDWLKVAQHGVDQGMGLLMHGGKGSGKTLMSTLVLRHLLGLGYEGYWTTMNAMLDLFTGGWRDPEERRWYHRRVKNAQVLVLDDLGRENRGSEVPRNALDEVIRHRTAQSASTILTSNDDPEKLTEAYGGNIASLLTEHVMVLDISGEDFRPTRHKLRNEEIVAGLTRPVILA